MISNLDVQGPVPEKELQASLHSAETGAERQGLDGKYGSLHGLLERAPDDTLLVECLTRCASPAMVQAAHPQPVGVGRMAWVLHNLCHQILHGKGLGAWLTDYLEEAPDTMAALRAIGAVEMERFLIDFAAQAAAENCDVRSSDSWKNYFKRRSRLREAAGAALIAPGIATHFRRWALASPAAVAAQEAALAGDKGGIVSVDAVEGNNVIGLGDGVEEGTRRHG